jgi:hypothetical protein
VKIAKNTLVGLFLLVVGVALASFAVWESVHFRHPVDPWKMLPAGLISLLGANFISSIVGHGFTEDLTGLVAVLPRGLLSAAGQVVGLGRRGADGTAEVLPPSDPRVPVPRDARPQSVGHVVPVVVAVDGPASIAAPATGPVPAPVPATPASTVGQEIEGEGG